MITLRHPVTGETTASFGASAFGGATGNTRTLGYINPASDTPRRHMAGRMPMPGAGGEPTKLLPETGIGQPHYPLGEHLNKAADDWARDKINERLDLAEASQLGMMEARPGRTAPAAAGMTAPGTAETSMTEPAGNEGMGHVATDL